MSPGEALEAIHGYAAANRIETAGHVRKRMRERGVTHADLRCALTGATECRAQANARWRVEGADLDGDGLTLIVVIEDGVIVVTVY